MEFCFASVPGRLYTRAGTRSPRSPLHVVAWNGSCRGGRCGGWATDDVTPGAVARFVGPQAPTAKKELGRNLKSLSGARSKFCQPSRPAQATSPSLPRGAHRGVEETIVDLGWGWGGQSALYAHATRARPTTFPHALEFSGHFLVGEERSDIGFPHGPWPRARRRGIGWQSHAVCRHGKVCFTGWGQWRGVRLPMGGAPVHPCPNEDMANEIDIDIL